VPGPVRADPPLLVSCPHDLICIPAQLAESTRSLHYSGEDSGTRIMQAGCAQGGQPGREDGVGVGRIMGSLGSDIVPS
jgi:hypothetical protein